MKDTKRMLAGYKAGETRRLNKLRQKVWDKLKENCLIEAKFHPNILPISEGGVELSFNMGWGLREIKFETREQALDYVVSVFCC